VEEDVAETMLHQVETGEMGLFQLPEHDPN
jgi:hypothetical protein